VAVDEDGFDEGFEEAGGAALKEDGERGVVGGDEVPELWGEVR